MTPQILCNAAKCLKCGDEVESKSRYDLRWCSCRSLGVDGGRDYVRRLGDDYIEMTKFAEGNGHDATM